MASKHESKPVDVKILLIGRTGVGKSSAGNWILGVKAGSGFSVQSPATTKKQCEQQMTTLSDGPGPLAGKTLAVVDTPGLCYRSKQKEEVREQLFQCFVLAEPGPDVFLWVVDLTRFTRDDENILNTFRYVFKGAECHTIVLFTHCPRKEDIDAFLKDKHNKSIRDFITSGPQVEYQAFDCKAENHPVSELLKKIHKLVTNNTGKPYNRGWLNMDQLFEEAKRSDPTLSVSRSEFPQLLIELGRDKLVNFCPRLKKFLEFLEDVVYKLMPDSAKQ